MEPNFGSDPGYLWFFFLFMLDAYCSSSASGSQTCLGNSHSCLFSFDNTTRIGSQLPCVLPSLFTPRVFVVSSATMKSLKQSPHLPCSSCPHASGPVDDVATFQGDFCLLFPGGASPKNGICPGNSSHGNAAPVNPCMVLRMMTTLPDGSLFLRDATWLVLPALVVQIPFNGTWHTSADPPVALLPISTTLIAPFLSTQRAMRKQFRGSCRTPCLDGRIPPSGIKLL